MYDRVTARAYTNIALIKYWGKENPVLNLPTTTSLSMTLDAFYTETSVSFDQGILADSLVLDGSEVDNRRVHTFLQMLRENIADFPHVLIESHNQVPTAAGLASSASSFAALTVAMAGLLELTAMPEELSRLARCGSGSASRSIYGNFAIWHKGEDDFSSYAESFLDEDIGLTMLVAHVSEETKKISSTDGMQRAQASAGYARWVAESEKALEEIKPAIIAQDIEKIGLIAEENALSMHALNRTAEPPFDYFTDTTRALVDFAADCYHKGFLAFATLDAGPNVKIITSRKEEEAVLARFKAAFPDIPFDICHAGPRAEVRDAH
ncbi:MAG: diphosphomevalonate decarboxylase [Streptococcaceae bacterium]|jgi:diphosphomevalonate decarboxylase|nr:diphosphomevalonate decarboxylase [Streptococcaceae bacterium]